MPIRRADSHDLAPAAAFRSRYQPHNAAGFQFPNPRAIAWPPRSAILGAAGLVEEKARVSKTSERAGDSILQRRQEKARSVLRAVQTGMLRRRYGWPPALVERDVLHVPLGRKERALPRHILAVRADHAAAGRRPRKPTAPRPLAQLVQPAAPAPWAGDGGAGFAEDAAGTCSGEDADAAPSLVVLCCRCGVMLDDEDGVTIRPAIGECDIEGCDNWACVRCSGVKAGYSGRWECGCPNCGEGATSGDRAGSPASRLAPRRMDEQ